MKNILLLLALISTVAFSNEEYVYVREQVENIKLSLDSSESLVHDSFVLNKIRVRARLEFGLEIPLIANVKIKPEVELFFTK